MRKIQSLILIIIWAAMGCATPTPADFKHSQSPLMEDEFLTIWRFPAKGSAIESVDTTASHFQALETQMAPIFEQLIPQILLDVKEGKLTIHERNDPGSMEENPIENVLVKMQTKRLFRTSWENIEPYKKVVHIVQRRKNDKRGFRADELKMEIIVQDPEGNAPERLLGFVFIKDLLQQNYTVKFEGKKYDFLDYFEKASAFAYPIYYQNKKMSNGLGTLKEAFGTKKYVLEGRFDEIRWLGFEANLTKYSSKILPKDQLEKFAGTYTFAASQKTHLITSKSPVKVQFSVQGEYLKVRWPDMHQYFQYRVFPTENDRFFTVSNDLIQFRKLDEGGIECIIKHDNGTVLKGIRD